MLYILLSFHLIVAFLLCVVYVLVLSLGLHAFFQKLESHEILTFQNSEMGNLLFDHEN